jgi:hypothetical protein
MTRRTDNDHDGSIEPIDRILHDTLRQDAPAEVHEASEGHFTRMEESLMREGEQEKGRFPALRWAGAMAAVLVAVGLFWLVTPSKVTWAEVANNFRSVRSFNATVFVTENIAEAPEKVEIWASRDGRVRVHQRDRVLFGKDGEVTEVWDTGRGMPIETGSLSRGELEELHLLEAVRLNRMLGSMKEFSLEALLAHFSGEKTISPPLPNADASSSRDMQVFDVTNDWVPTWLRVWALKSSGLPTRVRMWDPRDGDSMEMLFDYTGEQPDEAFDAAAFGEILSRKDGRPNRTYALLKDPGGRDITPGDIFEASGYHMPRVIEAGRTPEGLFWVKSGDSANDSPDGRTFYGFGRLEDNLGQEYLHRFLGHQTVEDLGLEYFIPLNMGAGYRPPTSYTLTCWAQPDHCEQAQDVIGSVDLTEWDETATVPAIFRNMPTSQQALKEVVREWSHRQNWDRFDALLAQIPGEPEDDDLAFFREYERLRKLELMNKDDEVFALAERLHPIVEARDADQVWRYERVLRNYVVGLAKRGRLDEAHTVLRPHVESVREAKSHDLTVLSPAEQLIRRLHEASVSTDAINDLFGFDVHAQPAMAEYLRMMSGSPGITAEDSRYGPWRAYIVKVGEYYNTHPLPEKVGIPEGVEPFDEDQPVWALPLPGHGPYRVTRIAGTWDWFVYLLAACRGLDTSLVQVAPELEGKEFSVLVVYRGALDYDAFLPHMDVETVERILRRPVWVARYDGRKLPDWRGVVPLDREKMGDAFVSGGGGTQTTARNLLAGFQQAINKDIEGFALTDDKVVIIDETGLPTQPGENQTWGSICLTHQYAFGKGEQATDMAKAWFEEKFGITFHEEERELKIVEVRPSK